MKYTKLIILLSLIICTQCFALAPETKMSNQAYQMRVWQKHRDLMKRDGHRPLRENSMKEYMEYHDGDWTYRVGEGSELRATLSPRFESEVVTIQGWLKSIAGNNRNLQTETPSIILSNLMRYTRGVDTSWINQSKEVYNMVRGDLEEAEELHIVFFYKDLMLKDDGTLVARGTVLKGDFKGLQDITEIASNTLHTGIRAIYGPEIVIGRIFEHPITWDKYDRYEAMLDELRALKDEFGQPKKIGTEFVQRLQIWEQMSGVVIDKISLKRVSSIESNV